MKKISINKVRKLHEIKAFYVIVAGTDYMITSDDLQGFAVNDLNRKAIKDYFKWKYQVDTNSWKYFTDDTGSVLLNI